MKPPLLRTNSRVVQVCLAGLGLAASAAGLSLTIGVPQDSQTAILVGAGLIAATLSTSGGILQSVVASLFQKAQEDAEFKSQHNGNGYLTRAVGQAIATVLNEAADAEGAAEADSSISPYIFTLRTFATEMPEIWVRYVDDSIKNNDASHFGEISDSKITDIFKRAAKTQSNKPTVLDDSVWNRILKDLSVYATMKGQLPSKVNAALVPYLKDGFVAALRSTLTDKLDDISKVAYKELALDSFGKILAQLERMETILIDSHRLLQWLVIDAKRNQPSSIEPEVPPNLLPPLNDAPDDFIGHSEIKNTLIAGAHRGQRLFAICGLPGIGKTAFALHFAHGLSAHYPMGLFVFDLLGTSRSPLRSDEIARLVLERLNPRKSYKQLSTWLFDEYHACIAEKNALLLFDNAVDEEQVERLLPRRNHSCLCIVTSRQHLNLHKVGLKPEYNFQLDVLKPSEAAVLLKSIAPRIGKSAGAIAKLCGYLPLALRAAASHIFTAEDITPEEYVKNLRDKKVSIAKLKPGSDPSVEAAISLSYDKLCVVAVETARVFRAMSIFSSSFSPEAEEEVCVDLHRKSAQDLERYCLLQWDKSSKRFRMHDFIREFSYDRLAEEHNSVADRYVQYYLEASRKLYGDLQMQYSDEMRDSEWSNVLAAQRIAADAQKWGDVISLTANIHDYLSRKHLWSAKRKLFELARVAAQNQLNPLREANALNMLGEISRTQGNLTEALDFMRDAESIFESLDATERIRGKGRVFTSRVTVYKLLGQYDEAVVSGEKALRISQGTANPILESQVRNNLGTVFLAMRRFSDAEEQCVAALTIKRNLLQADPNSKDILVTIGHTQVNLGELYSEQGLWEKANEHLTDALNLYKTAKDKYEQGDALGFRSVVWANLGRIDEAKRHSRLALDTAQKFGDPHYIINALVNRGKVFALANMPQKAVEALKSAILRAREMKYQDAVQKAMRALANIEIFEAE